MGLGARTGPRGLELVGRVDAADPASPLAAAYRDVARRAAARLALQAKNKAIKFPSIVFQNT